MTVPHLLFHALMCFFKMFVTAVVLYILR
jgi:hypothetical protein